MTSLKSSFVLMLQLFPCDFMQNYINSFTLKHHWHKLIMCPFPDISEHWSCPATSNIRTNDCRCWALSWKSCMTIKIQFPMFDFWSYQIIQEIMYTTCELICDSQNGCNCLAVQILRLMSRFMSVLQKNLINKVKHIKRFLFWMIAGIHCYSDLITPTYAIFMVL